MDGARKARPGRDLVGELLAIVEQPEGDVLTPEHALGEEPDARTVVYAAGARLYERLAGRPPFEGRTRGEAISAMLVRDPAPLKEVPPELAAVVMRALAKRPAARFQTVNELRAALEALEGEVELAGAEPVEPEAAVLRGTVPMEPLRGEAPPAEPAPPSAAGVHERPVLAPARVSFAVGAALLVALAAWMLLRPGTDEGSAASSPAAMVSKLEATRARGELAAARIQAETLAKAYPHDGRTFALLGHVLFAQGEKLRALAAYREAHHLDPSVGAAPELLANLRATFADPEHGEAAFRLAEAIGPPAKPILSDLAAHTSEARLKRRAAEASGRITRGEKSP